jgi:RND superfamily putative drug exporter
MRRRLGTLAPTDRLRLAAWLLAILPLAVLGIGVQSRLHSTTVLVSGTDAQRATALAHEQFGDAEYFEVLITGPNGRLKAEVTRVSRRIGARPGVRVLDPFTTGQRALLPAPGQALLLVGVDKPFESASEEAPRLRAALRRIVAAPFSVHMTGYADLAKALHDETVHAIERAEVLAAIPLVIVLLLVLGSPVGIAISLALGGTVVLGSWGVLDLINWFTALDVGALSLATAMGLALGVDYSLLMVARFQAELTQGAPVDQAARVASQRAGRTIRFAGVVLASAMVCALVVIPATPLKSTVVGVLVALGMGLAGATLVLPPLLRLAGRDINRYRLLPAVSQSGRWRALALRVMRRPVAGVVAVLVILVPLCIPVLGFPTGPPDPSELPVGAAARQDLEAIKRSVPATYAVPFVITVAARHGTLLDERSRRLAAFEQRLAHDPETYVVLGPPARLLMSGRVTPAMLATASARQRETISWTVNVDRGATAVQFLVVQRETDESADKLALPTRADNPFRDRLQRLTAQLGRQLDATALVGGPSATLSEFDAAVVSRLKLLVVALILVTYVALVVLMRNWLLPAIAVVLNLLSVGAAFGLLALAFGGVAPLGGPGYVDDVMAAVIFTVTFALSIDYQIFLLDRMREGYAETGRVQDAIVYGLQNTAGVITGAGAIMVVVFLAFAASPMPTMRQLGLGLAIAVLLDATLIRLVLLPAMLKLAGDRAWSRRTRSSDAEAVETALRPAGEGSRRGRVMQKQTQNGTGRAPRSGAAGAPVGLRDNNPRR